MIRNQIHNNVFAQSNEIDSNMQSPRFHAYAKPGEKTVNSNERDALNVVHASPNTSPNIAKET